MAADLASMKSRSHPPPRSCKTSTSNATKRFPIRIEKDGRWLIADRLPVIVLGGRSDRARARAHDAAPRARRTRSAPARASGRRTDDDDRTRRDAVDHRSCARRRVSGAAWSVRRRRHGAGAAGAGEHPVCRRRRAASAVGMDKAVAKLVFAARGLPQAKYLVVLRNEWKAASGARDERSRRDARLSRLRQTGESRIERRHLQGEISRPIFLRRSIWPAQFDRKIVIEAAVPNAREIEIAVLGNDRTRSVGSGRGHPVARVLRLRGQVSRRRLAHDHSG